jgi:hypothetical protein
MVVTCPVGMTIPAVPVSAHNPVLSEKPVQCLSIKQDGRAHTAHAIFSRICFTKETE